MGFCTAGWPPQGRETDVLGCLEVSVVSFLGVFGGRFVFFSFPLVSPPFLESEKYQIVEMKKIITPNGSTNNACCVPHVFLRSCFSPKAIERLRTFFFPKNYQNASI